ncbi:hypothetical protein EOA30_28385 [Mesorhizobium sp. M8A.F.Ca.ET.059.01.1.1]|nr:hypothetical protein EOA30_28385 [Mesorhizobium sp. M8A.F.Ca.ET.059.01.1.1]
MRDWVGFPAAIAALLTAFFTPTVAAILSWADQDRAYITAALFNPDTINVGLDDVTASAQVDKVTQYVAIIRVSLSNKGYSRASIPSNFSCLLQIGGKKRSYYFSFYDPASQKKIFPIVEAGETKILFGSLTSRKDKTQHGASMTADTCEFPYVDKYGQRRPYVYGLTDDARVRALKVAEDRKQAQSDYEAQRPEEAKRTDSERSKQDIMGLALDSDTEWQREKYCAGMLKDVRSEDKVIADCVSGTHIIAIEPENLWQRAVGRAFQSAAAFQKLTPDQGKRRPGLLLICQEYGGPKCESRIQKAGDEIGSTLGPLGIPVTVWLCDDAKVKTLTDCQRTDF